MPKKETARKNIYYRLTSRGGKNSEYALVIDYLHERWPIWTTRKEEITKAIKTRVKPFALLDKHKANLDENKDLILAESMACIAELNVVIFEIETEIKKQLGVDISQLMGASSYQSQIFENKNQRKVKNKSKSAEEIGKTATKMFG